MRVLFRADASATIGSGHVMRCVTLAEALAGRGVNVGFLCRNLSGNYTNWLISRGIQVYRLEQPSQTLTLDDVSDIYERWLAVPLSVEIAEVSSCLAGVPEIDWLVVDHYALDHRWERSMRRYAKRILAIDDLANRLHDCDLLLDQNFSGDQVNRYADLVPSGCPMLMGPSYALLRPEFIEWRNEARVRHGSVSRIFLFMGGSDLTNVTSKVLRALGNSRFADLALSVDVVTGQSNPHNPEIRALCARDGRLRHMEQVSNIAELMAGADLAIGATGASTWERAALGLPTLAVSIAENQREIARYAAQMGVLTWLGDEGAVSVDDWVDSIALALASPALLQSQASAGLALVDMLGVDRVIERML